MATPNQGKLFLKMAAHALLVGLEEIPGAGVAVKIGRGCWKILRDAQEEAARNERIEQLEEAATCTPAEASLLAHEVIAAERANGTMIAEEKAEAVADLLAAMPGVIREKTRATLRQAKKTGIAPHTVLPVTAQFDASEREAFYRSLFPARRSAFKNGDALPHHNPEWRLQELVGAGGFGEVWTARHEFLGEHWAVKFCQDAASAKILRREAQTLYALRQTLPKHPRIVALQDLQLKHEPYWLAFEYVPGGTLESLIRLGPMPFERALELLLPVVKAMAEVHAAGIIHRDLKPANLLIGEDGALKIADFGIGKVTAESEAGERRLTRMTGFTTQGYGSVGYMPPEQEEGRSAHLSDDVFALGVIFWQMCAGTSKPLRYPNQVGRLGLPEVVKNALMEAVFCERAERPQDAGKMLLVFEEHKHREAEEAKHKAEEECKRREAEEAKRHAVEEHKRREAEGLKRKVEEERKYREAEELQQQAEEERKSAEIEEAWKKGTEELNVRETVSNREKGGTENYTSATLSQSPTNGGLRSLIASTMWNVILVITGSLSGLLFLGMIAVVNFGPPQGIPSSKRCMACLDWAMGAPDMEPEVSRIKHASQVFKHFHTLNLIYFHPSQPALLILASPM